MALPLRLTTPALSLRGARRRAIARRVWRRHSLFVGAWSTYVIASLILGPRLGWQPAQVTVLGYFAFTLNFVVGALLVCTGELIRGRLHYDHLGMREGWKQSWTSRRRHLLCYERWISWLLVALLVPAVGILFASWKQSVGLLDPFSWDAALHSWDVALHAGRAPWEWLHPWLGHPDVTRTIDIIYAPVWMTASALFTPIVAFLRPSEWRVHLLTVKLIITAVLGSFCAVAFSSAGPIFAGLLRPQSTLADAYAPLIEYLGSVSQDDPLVAWIIRDRLWGAYAGAEPIFGAGISAMPSMHLAVATLMCCAAWHFGVRWRLLGCAYVLVILVGSVHLGWHYAVDGYVAIVATLLVWSLVSRYFNRRRMYPSSRAGTSLYCQGPQLHSSHGQDSPLRFLADDAASAVGQPQR